MSKQLKPKKECWDEKALAILQGIDIKTKDVLHAMGLQYFLAVIDMPR